MRRRAALIAVVALGLTLAGCVQPTDPDWRPRGWDGHDLVTLSSAPVPLRAADVPGLAGERLRNDDVGVQARVAVVPGADAVGARALQSVRAAIDARTAATGRAYAPAVFPRGAGLADRSCVEGSTLRPAADIVADPALGPAGASGTAVVCDIVAAAGTTIGQRIRLVEALAGAPVSDRSEVYFADVQTGALAAPRELWTADAAAALWAEVVDVLRREGGGLSLAPVAAPDTATAEAFTGVLDSTLPTPDGAFAVVVPAGFTAPALADLGMAPTSTDRIFAVPPARVATLASPAGAALSAALAEGRPFTPPAAVPSRTGSTDCRLVPCVAVTYDDGPGRYTPGILDALEAERSAATFFAIGEKAARNGDTLRRIVADGHELANHTWSHPHLTDIDADAVRRQIADTQNAFREATGVTPTAFRPPYGQYDAGVLAAAGLPAILWDVDTRDWQQPDDDVLIARAVDETEPRSIVLMHDIHERTARVTPAVIAGLRDRGFTLVPLTEAFGGRLPADGAWRSAR